MIMKNEIICLKYLGKGPFFDEYLVTLSRRCRKKPKFYLRVMKKSQITLCRLDESMVMIELAIRTAIRHPFLINQIFAFQDYDNLFYLSEFANIKLLRSGILPQTFSFETTRFYIAEIFLCLRYLHKKSQNYTFLTPHNILLDYSGHIKLSYDFCNCIEYSVDDIIENIEYSSYEYIKNKRFNYLSVYWSLGVITYEMLLGFTPFKENTLNDTVFEMCKCQLEIPEAVNPVAKSFIEMLIDKDLGTKFSDCESLERAITEHPIFKNIDLERLERKELEPPFKFSEPDYNLEKSPSLDVLYTTDYISDDKKDGYGNIFKNYNIITYLKNKQFYL